VTGGEPIRVLVVDDHAVVRRGVVAYLEAIEDLEVAGEAGTGQEAVDFLARAAAHQELPDVVLMDLQMPGMDGVTATGRISERHPDTAVLVLTSFSDQQRVTDALDAGAVGYVLKDTEPADLLDAIRAVARGHSPLDPRVARVVLHGRRSPAAPPSPPVELTDRELEVLALVGRGLANKQIARALGIREATVKAHLTSVFQRIGVRDRTSAALWAQEHLPRATSA
jgi:DNA-binding NarL/FixJ family response regulator